MLCMSPTALVVSSMLGKLVNQKPDGQITSHMQGRGRRPATCPPTVSTSTRTRCWVTPSWRTLRRSSLSWHLPSFSLLERRGQRLNWSQWRRSGGINCSLGLPGGWIQERMAPLDWEIRTSISFILFVLYSHSIVNLRPLPLSKCFEFHKSPKPNLLNILIWKSIKIFIFNFRYFEMLSLSMSTSTKQDAPT